jgi:hypothetical protein
MPNVLLTPTLLTRMTLMNLGGMLNVCRNMSKDYSKEFGKKSYKQGDKLQVRKPQRFEGTDNLTFTPEPLTNTQTTIRVDKVAGVHFEFDSVERTLSLEAIQERYAEPAALALASKINRRAAEYCALNTFNAVGTPGTTPTSMLTYLSAGDKLVEQGLPEEAELACIVNRNMSSTYVNATNGLNNPAAMIGSQIKKGVVQDQLGYNWYRDQSIYRHQIGALGGTPLVNGSGQTGTEGNNANQSLITDGWTASAATRLKAGDRFTLGVLGTATAVESVHPQTRQATGALQQFVVLEDGVSDGSGNMTLSIFPSITPSGQYQNVSQAAADNCEINPIGSASTVTRQGLLMHKNAFAFLSVPLEDPDEKGVEMVARETDSETGLTLSFIRAFDARTRTHITRFDTLYGFGRLYPEMACAIYAA